MILVRFAIGLILTFLLFYSPQLDRVCALRVRDHGGFLGAGFWMKAAENSGCYLKVLNDVCLLFYLLLIIGKNNYHNFAISLILTILNSPSWIEYVLSVFETTEVFLELAGLKFGGPAGRWAVIVAVQVNFFILYSTLLHLPPLRFHCNDGCWDRTQDCCNATDALAVRR